MHLDMNVFLENEFHECCILKNLLDRSTAQYLVIREKINYISTMMQKYETKYAKVKVYYKRNVNLLDESNIEKSELEAKLQANEDRRARHLAILRSERKRIQKSIEAQKQGI